MDLWTLALGGAGGLVASLAKDLVGRWFRLQDKETERRALHADQHRTELKDAYARFVPAYSHFLASGGLLLSLMMADHELGEEAYEEAVRSGADERMAEQARLRAEDRGLKQRVSDEMETFARRLMDADEKAISVLLLEHDGHFARQVQPLMEIPLNPPQGAHDFARFRHDLHSRQKLLDELARGLTGRFAPPAATVALASRRA